MPEITYKCNLCKTRIVKLHLGKGRPSGFMGFCMNQVKVQTDTDKDGNPIYTEEPCLGVFERELHAPTVIVKETRDNGAMARKVEQHKDVKEILVERSKKHENKD